MRAVKFYNFFPHFGYYFSSNGIQKKAEKAIFISDKIDFKLKITDMLVSEAMLGVVCLFFSSLEDYVKVIVIS